MSIGGTSNHTARLSAVGACIDFMDGSGIKEISLSSFGLYGQRIKTTRQESRWQSREIKLQSRETNLHPRSPSPPRSRRRPSRSIPVGGAGIGQQSPPRMAAGAIDRFQIKFASYFIFLASPPQPKPAPACGPANPCEGRDAATFSAWVLARRGIVPGL